MPRKKPTASPSELWQAAASVPELDVILTRRRASPPAGPAIVRKLWLFAVAGGRMAWDALPAGPARAAIEVGGRAADGAATAAEVRKAAAAVRKARAAADRERNDHYRTAFRAGRLADPEAVTRYRFLGFAYQLADAALTRPDGWGEPGEVAAAISALIVPPGTWSYWESHFEMPIDEGVEAAADARIAGVFRDLLGDPFDPVTFEKTWLTSAVVGLATAIHAERAFDRLPILADALEEAGCGDGRVLGHCRGGGEHVTGCWVIDGLFGRNWVPRAGRTV